MTGSVKGDQHLSALADLSRQIGDRQLHLRRPSCHPAETDQIVRKVLKPPCIPTGVQAKTAFVPSSQNHSFQIVVNRGCANIGIYAESDNPQLLGMWHECE